MVNNIRQRLHTIPTHKTQCVYATDGRGGWSGIARNIPVTSIEVSQIEGFGKPYGEMRVYFDTKTWNTRRDGLIYSDPMFICELRESLKEAGWDNVNDICYSEQGMQESDYVSLDVGHKFLENFS
jgi:hypothetical protein